MAAYKVGETRTGVRIWWASWMSHGGYAGVKTIRDASQEEQELMEKVVWDNDTPADLDRLKRLINSDAPSVIGEPRGGSAA